MIVGLWLGLGRARGKGRVIVSCPSPRYSYTGHSLRTCTAYPHGIDQAWVQAWRILL